MNQVTVIFIPREYRSTSRNMYRITRIIWGGPPSSNRPDTVGRNIVDIAHLALSYNSIQVYNVL